MQRFGREPGTAARVAAMAALLVLASAVGCDRQSSDTAGDDPSADSQEEQVASEEASQAAKQYMLEGTGHLDAGDVERAVRAFTQAI